MLNLFIAARIKVGGYIVPYRNVFADQKVRFNFCATMVMMTSLCTNKLLHSSYAESMAMLWNGE